MFYLAPAPINRANGIMAATTISHKVVVKVYRHYINLGLSGKNQDTNKALVKLMLQLLA